jgi:hypothetical protein
MNKDRIPEKVLNMKLKERKKAGMAQSVQQRAMGWMIEVKFLGEARFFSSPQCPF